MSNIIDDIKNIIFNFIENKYKEFLKDEQILLIKEKNMKNIIRELYENNCKILKDTIRKDLKEKYKDSYPGGTVENTILDIFQDKELNIERLSDEFTIIQKKNKYDILLPIINNSLNLNISIADNFIIINSTNTKKIGENDPSLNEVYNLINNYKFIYSIEDIILEEYDNNEKINIIKKTIENRDNINIQLYYLKIEEK
tara:strand:+ start:2382 stop:2978 length:597 start_codon:yes stop_codon:yes gene_type:complete